MLSKSEIESFGVKALDTLDMTVDCLIVTVPHREFTKMSLEDLGKIMNENPVLVDVKGVFDFEKSIEEGFNYIKL